MSDLICICNVCTCGSHKCPVPTHQTTHYDPNDLLSEYKRDYPAWDVQAPPTAGPRSSYTPSNVPFEGTSTQHADFPRYGADAYARPCPLGHNNNAPREHIPFTGETSNRADYVPHAIEPVTSAGPRNDYVPSSVPFEGTSTQHADFPKYGQDAYAQRNPAGGAHGGAPREAIPFEGSTTNRDDFRAHPITPVRSSGPQREYVPNNIPFEGESLSHSSFPRYGADAYKQQAPMSSAGQAPRESIPFEGSTTNRDAYVPHAITPVRSAAPRQGGPVQTVPFEGTSTQHADFPKYGQDAYARPQVAGASQQPREHIPFTGETSNRADYVPHAIEPVTSAGPRNDYVPSSVPFEGTSTQHADFPKYGQDAYAQRNPAGGAHGGAPREAIPFEGSTTNRDDFRAHPITPVRSSGPQREYVPNNIPFEGESMAHSSYRPYEINVCPATLLPPHNPAADGHSYYSNAEVEKVSPRKKQPQGW